MRKAGLDQLDGYIMLSDFKILRKGGFDPHRVQAGYLI